MEDNIPTEHLDVDTQISKQKRPHLDAFVIFREDGKCWGATITQVFSDTCVNIRYVDVEGINHTRTSVMFGDHSGTSWSWPKIA